MQHLRDLLARFGDALALSQAAYLLLQGDRRGCSAPADR